MVHNIFKLKFINIFKFWNIAQKCLINYAEFSFYLSKTGNLIIYIYTIMNVTMINWNQNEFTKFTLYGHRYGCLLSNLKINYKIFHFLMKEIYENGMTNKMKIKNFFLVTNNKNKNNKNFTSVTTVSFYDVR